MKWPVRIAAAILIAAVAFVVGRFYLTPGWTPADLRSQVARELPNGLARDRVASWFRARRIPFSTFSRLSPEDRKVDLGGELDRSFQSLAGLDEAEVDSAIVGRITGSRAKLDPIFTGEIKLFAMFDADGKLLGTYVTTISHSF